MPPKDKAKREHEATDTSPEEPPSLQQRRDSHGDVESSAHQKNWSSDEIVELLRERVGDDILQLFQGLTNFFSLFASS